MDGATGNSHRRHAEAKPLDHGAAGRAVFHNVDGVFLGDDAVLGHGAEHLWRDGHIAGAAIEHEGEAAHPCDADLDVGDAALRGQRCADVQRSCSDRDWRGRGRRRGTRRKRKGG
jgi:hypothetical protein